MTELKNCPVPWCNGEAFSLFDAFGWSKQVTCTKCGCTARDVETWNTRADGWQEADAARYRWLRDHSCPPHNFYISVPDEFHGVRYAPADVDAYIDAALDRLKSKEADDGQA